MTVGRKAPAAKPPGKAKGVPGQGLVEKGDEHLRSRRRRNPGHRPGKPVEIRRHKVVND